MRLYASETVQHALSRRHFLLCGAAAVANCLLPGAAIGAVGGASVKERSLALHNLHTLEDLEVVYWKGGQYLPQALEDINYIFRDRRTEETCSIDTGLLDLLHTFQQRLKTNRPLHLVCGYRSPKTNAMLRRKSRAVAKRSLHLRGMAVDIRVPGFKTSSLRKTAAAIRGGGVGYYPQSGFVHLDVGPVRYW